jgi:hypothetical protein
LLDLPSELLKVKHKTDFNRLHSVPFAPFLSTLRVNRKRVAAWRPRNRLDCGGQAGADFLPRFGCHELAARNQNLFTYDFQVPERVLSRTLLTFGPAGRAAPGLRRWDPMANAHEILEKMMNERKLAEVFEGWVQSMRSELKHRTIDEVREAFEPVELYQRLDGTRGFTVRFKQTGEVFSVDFEAEWLH